MLKNKGKGWHIFFAFIILVLSFIFSPRVFALEEERGNSNFEQITREDIFNYYSEKMNFDSEKVVYQSEIGQTITVLEFLSNISISGLEEDYVVQSVQVVDSFGTILNYNDVIYNGSYLVIIGDGFVSHYLIEVFGDYNQDNILNEEDVNISLDSVINGNERVQIEEVSYIDYVVTDQNYQIPEVSDEHLENHLEATSAIVGENVSLKYSICGFDKNYMNAIQGELQYDENMLELKGIYLLVNGEVKGRFQDKYFAYLLGKYSSQDVLMIIEFRTLSSGYQQVSINRIKAVMNGVLLDLGDYVEVGFMVEEYGKGGDIEDIVLPNDNVVYNDSSIFSNNSVSLKMKQVVQKATPEVLKGTDVALSNDNYIENLIIQGYDISFDKNIENYSIEVDDNVDSLNFKVVLVHDNATYFIKGNESFKTGINIVVLTVQAEDGSTRNYVIEVNKKEQRKEKNIDKIDTEKIKKGISILGLIILMGSVVWCLYLCIKKED